MLTGLYLMLNGIERFLIELIRVNVKYDLFGLHPTQAEIIAPIFFLSGVFLMWWSHKHPEKSNSL
jgi:prolipoprotein diacylglyceryltransferase